MINTIKNIIIKGILVSIGFVIIFIIVKYIIIPKIQKETTETLVNSINNSINAL